MNNTHYTFVNAWRDVCKRVALKAGHERNPLSGNYTYISRSLYLVNNYISAKSKKWAKN